MVKSVKLCVSSTLQSFCSSNNYLFFDRIKSVESLSEKLEGGRVGQWSELEDLYACTIIVPTSAHEAAVLRKLDACFERVDLRSRDTVQKPPDVFRFDATRYYARLGDDLARTREPGIEGIKFEVQINTVFEFAWTRVTHDIVYKSGSADWSKQRLAAQLKAAVEQIETVINSFEQTASKVSQSSFAEIDTKAAIVSFFSQLFDDGLMPRGLEPASWRRFSDNVYALVRSYSRNNHAVPAKIEELIQEISTALRGPTAAAPPASGSLFQFVLGHVASPASTGNLDNFVVVPSEELQLYGVHDVPKQFVFDLPQATGVSEPGDVA